MVQRMFWLSIPIPRALVQVTSRECIRFELCLHSQFMLPPELLIAFVVRVCAGLEVNRSLPEKSEVPPQVPCSRTILACADGTRQSGNYAFSGTERGTGCGIEKYRELGRHKFFFNTAFLSSDPHTRT